jgi:hypothetical protein
MHRLLLLPNRSWTTVNYLDMGFRDYGTWTWLTSDLQTCCPQGEAHREEEHIFRSHSKQSGKLVLQNLPAVYSLCSGLSRR